MKKSKLQNLRKKLRKGRTRSKIFGTEKRPRLSVFRSNKYIYAQLIDDDAGNTLLSVSTQEVAVKGAKVDQARSVGEKLAAKAKKGGIKTLSLNSSFGLLKRFLLFIFSQFKPSFARTFGNSF